jgi:hypothetical protein
LSGLKNWRSSSDSKNVYPQKLTEKNCIKNIPVFRGSAGKLTSEKIICIHVLKSVIFLAYMLS